MNGGLRHGDTHAASHAASSKPSSATSGSSKRATASAFFAPINRAYADVFRPGELTVGLVVPIESYPNQAKPSMAQHLQRVQSAEALGFSAVWLRDVPFNVPSFGDAGQLFDPFAYLGFLAGRTERIALGVASIVLPLRHPAHVAKAAASVDVLSGGRLLLGVASGDRPEEYPALGVDFQTRGAKFRESLNYIRRMGELGTSFESPLGSPAAGMELLPKPVGTRLPLLITGGSQQDRDWLARHGDGWMIYPRSAAEQAERIGSWRARSRALLGAEAPQKPAMQPLYIDLMKDPNHPPAPIHLGLRLGVNALRSYLEALRDAGINHVALNLRFNQADIDATLQRLATDVLPGFHSFQKRKTTP